MWYKSAAMRPLPDTPWHARRPPERPASAAALTLLLGCLALAGSAARRPASAAPPAEAVAYTLRLLPGPPLRVEVELRVRGERDGTSRFAIAPSWGGVERCERFVRGLSVAGETGAALPLTGDPALPHAWEVRHPPGAALVARYELHGAAPDPLSDFRARYEPVVRDGLLHLIGDTALLGPDWLDDGRPIELRLAWEGFAERGWTTIASFDGFGEPLRVPLAEFRHGMFLAGRLRVEEREIRGGRVRLALHGDDWGFEDAELADLVARIVAAEREFVGDFSEPRFLVTVVPTGPPATPHSFSLGGTGLSHAFALFLPPGTAVGPASPHRDRILRLLAHEHFHAWTGGAIATEQPEELVYWFSEGFTDFFASRILRRAGLIDDARWTERLNESLRKLWLSPAATEPAETIRREFWTRGDVQELPYTRGEAVALALDEEIRRVSGGRRSLDDWFRELLAAGRRGERAGTARLLERAAEWTSAAFADSLRRVVVDGALPRLPARIRDPEAQLGTAERHRFDPGFELEASLAARVVSGVRAGSAAHAAGLRDGQPLAGFSVQRGEPDREISLTVREGGGSRTIAFFPRGEPVAVPEYRRAAGGAEGSPGRELRRAR